MKISTNFAPPFKLIAPFFIIGVFVFVVSIITLFWFDIQTLTTLDSKVLSWVHLFLLGFVMMVIFGAMAQLVPVVFEVEHFAVELYYAIYPLLLLGTILMVVGFVKYPIVLPFGGVVAFISFGIFLVETFLTLLKLKQLSFVTLSVIIANFFLLLGLVVGIILALGYSGMVVVDLNRFLTTHIYFVFVGYVGISIMGMSLVLLPMFWLSHSFSWKWVKLSLGILSCGVVCVGVGALINVQEIQQLGYIATLLAILLYGLQIAIIHKTKVRSEKDIYFKSIVASFVFFVITIVLAGMHLYNSSQSLLLTLGWFGFGFISFMISGHLYKIIPFLVWYERFSPYVGKRKVPMLADMVPVRSANMQFLFSTVGFSIVGVALLLQMQTLFFSGVSFLVIGTIFLVKDIVFMINFKG